MKKLKYYLGVCFSILLVVSCTTKNEKANVLRLNDVQVIGSHNSYKQRIDPFIWDMMYQEDSALAISLDYTHISLVEQLNLGLRALELDVFHDPKGGKYSNPLGIQLQKEAGIIPPTFDSENRFKEPGLKLFHIQDLDFRSDFVLFKDALKALKKWSVANPDHLPVFITVNAKDDSIDRTGFIKPLPFTQTALDSIDLEIASVFGDEMLITPDLIRGESKSLEQMILTKGWPELDKVKGRFMFVLDERGQKRANYIAGHIGLKGRKMFVNAPVGTSESAFVILNNPLQQQNEINELVNKGYIVRTRADEATIEARNNDYSRFNLAVKSGAQIISTDYYLPDSLIGTGFKITFADGEPYCKWKK